MIELTSWREALTGAGVALAFMAGVYLWEVQAQMPIWCGEAICNDTALGALPEELCIAGRPAMRSGHVTYAGLEPRPGYERDHCIPLGLGGADDASNVWYQPLDEARRKDVVEHRKIKAYCRGSTTRDEARLVFAGICRPGVW